MAFVEDFTCYFADFGVDATLDGAAVRVIFDDAFQGAGFGPRDEMIEKTLKNAPNVYQVIRGREAG